MTSGAQEGSAGVVAVTSAPRPRSVFVEYCRACAFDVIDPTYALKRVHGLKTSDSASFTA